MLEINHLSVTFNEGTPDEKQALSDVNLTVSDGDFVTMIGSNGAGKSTLLNAIIGAVRPDAGSIKIDGTDITRLPTHAIARQVGIVYQNPLQGTAPDLTIEENLAMASSKVAHRPFAIALTARTRELLRDEAATLGLGLEDRMTTPVGLLSGGQRQALTLLMATSANPRLLLLDEHTAALDPATAALIIDMTRSIVTSRHLTTLMVTHNIKNALDYGDHLLLMDDGRVKLFLGEEEKKTMTVQAIMELYQNNLADSMVLGRGNQ